MKKAILAIVFALYCSVSNGEMVTNKRFSFDIDTIFSVSKTQIIQSDWWSSRSFDALVVTFKNGSSTTIVYEISCFLPTVDEIAQGSDRDNDFNLLTIRINEANIRRAKEKEARKKVNKKR
ncbi:MAG: hypothetical protein PHY56_00970 [Candidatus Omnitrophica bacterium]|jgi:hypothetical protein|nr:hypothetical protein [Candidatus Omnitrophota bacterium]